MASENELKRISKFLSYLLRHHPDAIGITLDGNGWTDVAMLIEKMQANGHAVDFALLKEVVATNSKQRFAFSDDFTKIRANQGHSITINLDYEAQEPPAVLYHGTSEHTLPAILQEGLHKRDRHHVHLSGDVQTAKAVGQRHGKPVVLVIDARQMHEDGYLFFQSANGVWLTEHVPIQYLQPAH